ncbi:hypothetical protein [Mesonia aquimarina]|uniref:hypothetical protein n=1 Tax=Mesonia aquimarina TaxID=1504967 RepID=UPI000EF5B574|nr:hypothetical protein [Mesonia aquimarina]
MKKLLCFIFLALASVQLQAQCAMCRAVLESETDGGAAEAINDGIMYLMVFPYLLMGGIAFFVWRMARDRKKAH